MINIKSIATLGTMMVKIILMIIIFTTNAAFSQGCIIGGQPSIPRYVCFDGRTAEKTEQGFVWNAKRGCFVSSSPCCNYNATHYAFYPNSSKIGQALARCRHDYPFHLGEMQTH